MAWEKRKRHKYFYCSRRVGHQVKKIYLGRGDEGRGAELALEIRKEERIRAREWLRKATAAFASADLVDAVLAVELAAVLTARAGLSMDGRRARRTFQTWRRKKMEDAEIENVLPPAEQETWEQLCTRAGRGDQQAADALLPMLDSNPRLVARWGDLSGVALRRWIEIIAGNNTLQREAMHRQVLDMVKGLRQFPDDPLEETLARRVGLMWLQASYFDSQVAMAVRRSPREQQALAKRQQEAQQLYPEAVRVLREYQDLLEAARLRRPR